MLAMCVRKPGDSSGGSLQSHVHSAAQTATATVQIKSTRKQKSSGLKVLKRGSKNDVADLSYSQQAIPPASRIPPPPPSTTSTGAVPSTRSQPVSTQSKVRDDPEGHLIYSRGDRLEARCKSERESVFHKILQLVYGLSEFMM